MGVRRRSDSSWSLRPSYIFLARFVQQACGHDNGKALLHLVDSPLVICPGAPGSVEISLGQHEMLGPDLDPETPGPEYHLTFFRTDGNELGLEYSIVDSADQVVVGKQTLALERHLERLLRSRPEAPLADVTDSDQASELLADAATRELVGMAGAGRFHSTPKVVSYGDTGRPSFHVQHSTLRFGQDTLAQSQTFDHTRVTSWVASQREKCKAVGANSTEMTCSRCFEMADVTSCDTTLISAQKVMIRDDILIATFVPSDYQLPLKVKITKVQSHALQADNLCGEDLPQPYPDVYVALTKLDKSGTLFDPEFVKVASNSNGLAVVIFFGFFACFIGCLVCVICIAWYLRPGQKKKAPESDDEGSTLFSARARG